jgi:hypothetical protein
MLLNNVVEIKIYKNSKNKNYYRDKGYKITDKTDKILVKVSDLQNSSTFKVNVICDVCKKEKLIKYRNYLSNIQKYQFYSCLGKCSRIKFVNTNLERYGFKNSSQCNEVKDKIKTTNLEKYNVENVFQNEKIKEKIKGENLIKYGVENPNQREEVRDKYKETCLNKFGVEHPMQNEDVFNKSEKNSFISKQHKTTGLYFRSSYEKHFLDFCIINNIEIEQGKRIKYVFDGKEHYYFSDYFIKDKNLIIEIKSSWTYNKNLIINEVKKKFTISNGYDFLFLIDKNYKELERYLKF